MTALLSFLLGLLLMERIHRQREKRIQKDERRDVLVQITLMRLEYLRFMRDFWQHWDSVLAGQWCFTHHTSERERVFVEGLGFSIEHCAKCVEEMKVK